MAVRKANIPDIGTITLYKRRHVKNVRLSISHDGKIRVTLPLWAPYKVGIQFVESKADWIRSKTGTAVYFQQGERIGKAHQLNFVHKPGVSKVTSRIVGTIIQINMPSGASPEDNECQTVVRLASIRALKREAEQLLPRRLEAIAKQHGFEYTDVRIKQLRSRWGSCTQHKEIVLNCYLMQLPWHLIDYVILHELLHTEVMAHGRNFWDRLEGYIPEVKAIRKEIKAYQPTLMAQEPIISGQTEEIPIPVN